jgi:cytochrome c
MSRFPSLLPAALAVALAVAPARADRLDLGREALPEEIAAWDIDVRPDGTGLPEGRGTVARGLELFDERCAACHGEFGEGAGRWPELAGGRGTLGSEDPVKTIGSYWPYLSSAFDYIHRAMPFGDAQSLTADETYALVAYLLYLNDIVTDEKFELSKENFTSVRLPNEMKFFDDPRPDARNVRNGEPCMTDCKATVEITGRARVLDVTPDDQSDNRGRIE